MEVQKCKLGRSGHAAVMDITRGPVREKRGEGERKKEGGAQCTKIDFRGSFRGARVKIENQDKTNIDFFPYSGTTGFRSNF